MILLACIFIVLAAICSAFMNVVENENFFVSIFKNLNQRFWYKRESWKHAKKIFGWKLDAWHIAKSLMVVFFAGAVISALFIRLEEKALLVIICGLTVIGVLWNLTFNLFYNKIFKK